MGQAFLLGVHVSDASYQALSGAASGQPRGNMSNAPTSIPSRLASAR
jgi:hypothetical protein